MTMPWRRAVWLFVALLVLPTPVLAAGGGGGGGGGGGDEQTAKKQKNPEYAAGVEAVEAKQYARAVTLLEVAVQRTPDDADAWNQLAYATRKNGDPAKSIPLYEKALALDPKHVGAHEYIGEAYLALDNLTKAREHLAKLNRICFFSCEEYRDLKKAVEAYEKRKGKPAASN